MAAMVTENCPGLTPDQAAAKLAADLRVGLGLTGRIDPEAVAGLLGIPVVARSMTTDAFLKEAESGYVIGVNADSPKSRRRFSVAHELGHLKLYETTGLAEAFGSVSQEDRDSPLVREVEQLCDHFAVELLMPSAEWVKAIYTQGVSLHTFGLLRREYGVSLEAALRRAVDSEVGLGRYAIILWRFAEPTGGCMQPHRFWATSAFGMTVWPDAMDMDELSEQPGSPVRASRCLECTTGEIELSFAGQRIKYLVQSSSIRGQRDRAVSLVVAGEESRRSLRKSPMRANATPQFVQSSLLTEETDGKTD